MTLPRFQGEGRSERAGGPEQQTLWLHRFGAMILSSSGCVHCGKCKQGNDSEAFAVSRLPHFLEGDDFAHHLRIWKPTDVKFYRVWHLLVGRFADGMLNPIFGRKQVQGNPIFSGLQEDIRVSWNASANYSDVPPSDWPEGWQQKSDVGMLGISHQRLG